MLVNLTPHVINISTPKGEITIAPSGTVARVSSWPGHQCSMADGVPVYTQTSFGHVEGLPDMVDDTVYIVSGLVASSLTGFRRYDVVSPGTGPNDGAIRNDEGQIVAVTRLVQAPQ